MDVCSIELLTPLFLTLSSSSSSHNIAVLCMISFNTSNGNPHEQLEGLRLAAVSRSGGNSALTGALACT